MSSKIFRHYLLLSLTQLQQWPQLDAGLVQLRKEYSRRHFFYLFALCARWFKGEQLTLPLEASLERYELIQAWHGPEFARVYLLMHLAELVEAEEFQAVVNELFKTADVNELTLLVQSLPLLPGCELFKARAREAARSNIEKVFCALTQNSDYAKHYFDEQGWNQLVLKAAFMEVPIWSIEGLRERNNAQLISMLKNYAYERQAAGRPVPWDLYCCIGWRASNIEDTRFLTEQYHKTSNKTQHAIRLALSQNPHPNAQALAVVLAEDSTPMAPSWPAVANMEEQEAVCL